VLQGGINSEAATRAAGDAAEAAARNSQVQQLLALPKGDPGGNVESVGLFSGLPTKTIPAGTDTIQTSGRATLGKGAARYKRSSGLPAWGQGKWWQADAQGNQWELAEAQPTSNMFGTVGDASVASPTSGAAITDPAALVATVTGTDVTQNIQDLVDYCLFKKIKTATLSEGRHKTSGPIHLGYGGSFSAVSLVGRGSYFGPWDSSFSGSAIIATHSNAPIISVQGARDIYIEGLTLYGLYANWVGTNKLASDTSTQSVTIDDTNIANWVSPALNANQDSRYTPFAGIAVDPYSGARPATSYPDVVYPSWTGISTQYGKLQSSKVTIRDVGIYGVIAGVAIQPSDNDANGDFVELHRVYVQFAKYMVSAGNAQGRNVGLRGCTFNQVHTLLEGRTHGKQSGRFQGVVSNISGSSIIQILNVSASLALPIDFHNCYFEGVWRIGNIVGSSALPLVFTATEFLFPMAVLNNTRGQPANHLSGSTTRETGIAACQAPVRFIGCEATVESVLVLIAQDVSFDGVIRPTERDTGTVSPYQAYAHNGLAGGLVVYEFGDAPNYAVNISARYKQIDGATGVVGNDVSVAGGRFVSTAGARKYGSPVYARWLEPALQGTAVSVRPKAFQFAKSSFTGAAQTGRVVTLTDTNPLNQSERTGRRPGDVWIDRQTATVFFVTSHDTATRVITLKQQNNFKGNVGAESNVQALALGAGEFQCISTRRFTPDYPLFVNSTAGSPTLGSAATADGNTAPINGTAGPAVGDYFALNNYEDNMVSQDGTTITALTPAGPSITMSANALEAQTRKRLLAFRAAPPANVIAP
jgi:hypothetical protein